MKVYQATITDHSDFGNVIFNRFFTTEAAAEQYGEGELAEALIGVEPMFRNSYELSVRVIEVFE